MDETSKKKKMTREDAAELYRDLHKTMSKMKNQESAPQKNALDTKVAKQIAEAIRASMKKDDALKGQRLGPDLSENIPDEARRMVERDVRTTPVTGFQIQTGSQFAITCVVFFLLAKVTFAVLEYSGVFGVPNAQAKMQQLSSLQQAAFSQTPYSESEVALLKQLDAKRVELEERKNKILKRERELDMKDQEYIARLTEIRDLTERLKMAREKSAAQKNSQLEQLSNVYGSMNPTEAAQLIEQLDITIALGLIERMPEKRIGQILALMSPERALTITKMLSTRERT